MFELALVGGAIAAVLFLTSANYVLDVYSAVNSSPWTAETVTGGDPEKERSLLRYCIHAAVQVVLLIGITAFLARSLWWVAVAGGGLELAYMSWLYYDAVQRGRKKTAASFDDNWSGAAKESEGGEQPSPPAVSPLGQFSSYNGLK